MGALTRYCKASPKTKWIVCSCQSAKDLAERILKENGLSRREVATIYDLSEVNSLNGSPDMVIVFELTLQTALKTQQSLKKFKDAGIPVVFGNARDIFFEKPTVVNQGISYAGMFQLCSAFIKGVEQTNSVKSSYAEFGVFDGRTCSLAWQMLQEDVVKFYAFDSFEGINLSAPGEEKFYETGSYYSNESTFRLNMALAGVPSEKLISVKCDFDQDLETSQNHNLIQERIGIVHIDCDVYPAAFNALQFVTPHLADGCLFLFDDYDSMWARPDRGEVRALNEWIRLNPDFYVTEYRRYSATGRAFLCCKK